MIFHGERINGFSLFHRIYNSLHIPSEHRERETCRYLCISAQTLRRYLSGKSEPPAPLVALLWHESDYGRAALDGHSHTGMLYARAESDGLKSEALRLRTRIARLEAEILELKTEANEHHPRLSATNDSFFQRA